MKIKIVKTVTFRDCNGTVLKVYNVGDIIDYTAVVDKMYYVTSMGGIWFDEAVIV